MSRSATEALPLVIDVEASGFGPGSYPIEVGFVTADGQAHCTLIRPDPSWIRWDAGAQAVHHLSRETLMRHGRHVEDVAHWLNGYLQDQTVYTDAWGNDYAWLSLLFDVAGSRPTFRLESLRALLDERDLLGWHPTRERVQHGLALTRHRASSDARVLQQTLLQVRRARGHAV